MRPTDDEIRGAIVGMRVESTALASALCVARQQLTTLLASITSLELAAKAYEDNHIELLRAPVVSMTEFKTNRVHAAQNTQQLQEHNTQRAALMADITMASQQIDKIAAQVAQLEEILLKRNTGAKILEFPCRRQNE